jgi:hypothetical protein
MLVTIIETKTQKVIGTFSVVLGIYGQDLTEQDYCNEAWECAVDDGLVDRDKRADYSFLTNSANQ